MKNHSVHVFSEALKLEKEHQLAWKFASVAKDPVPVRKFVSDMIINRIIDNAAVAVAAINRDPVQSARQMALAHPKESGATVFGMPHTDRYSAEWAAWANGTAVRELDYHDTFLAADYAHPADCIPPLLAVAQQCKCRGEDLVRAIATSYEIHVSLTKSICLHKHKIDHIAHLAPAVAAGIGTLLDLPTDQIYQAIQQALHVSCTTRQSRKGEISSWKAFAPAHAGKLAIEAVDRAMRGEKAPSPIYEGEDSVIAWLLDGKEAFYLVPLPEAGEEKKAILETYTKEHSAEYQSQAIIDLAFKMGRLIEQETDGNWDFVDSVTLQTSHHTHHVIGTGAGDPQKLDPNASRETLDHSIMYILAVALQDQKWHHIESYLPSRAHREDTVRLWHKIKTVEDHRWTGRYHSDDPKLKAFGGRLIVELRDGRVFEDEIAVANAHPFGAHPFERRDYIYKFKTLTDGILSEAEQDRFLDLVQRLPELSAHDLLKLNPSLPLEELEASEPDHKGIF